MPEITRTLQESDSGQAITLSPGEQFELTLSGNPTSGYQWEVSSYNAAYIQPAAEPGFQQSSDLVGAGGYFQFRFQAVKPGRTTLKLVYRRPFEKQSKPLRTFTLKISVSREAQDNQH